MRTHINGQSKHSGAAGPRFSPRAQPQRRQGIASRGTLLHGLLLLVCFQLADDAHGQVIKRWAGPVNGDWNTAGNWSPLGVPATNDYVIVNSGSIALSNSVTVGGTLSWTGGTIQRAFNVATPVSLTILSNCNWSGGTLGNLILRVNSGSVLNIHGPIAGVALQGELANAGTVNWLSGPIFGACSGFGPIMNLPGGVWDIRCDQPLSPCGLGATAYFQNEGVLRKSASLGATDWGIPLINAGTVSILEGTFRHAGGGAIDGHYDISSGASLEFASRAFHYTTDPVFAGEGSVKLASGSLALQEDLVPGLELVGGTITLGERFQGGAITNLTLGTGLTCAGSNRVVGVFNCEGAHLSGPLTVAESGIVNWRGGTISGAVNVSPSGVLNIDSATWVGLAGALTNAGIVNWLAGSILPTCASFGPVVNLPGALWEIQCDQSLANCGVTANGYFQNLGILRKSGPIGITEWGIPLRNAGVVSVLAGTLRLNGGGLLESNFEAANSAAIHLNQGNFVYSSKPALSGPGSYQLTGGTLTFLDDVFPNFAIRGGTVALGPGFQGGAITNLTLSGGTLAGTNRVTGTFNWGGTTLSGHVLVQDGATMTWSNGSAAVGITVEPNGHLVVAAPGTVTSQGPVTNQGTISILQGTLGLNAGLASLGGTLRFGMRGLQDFGKLAIAGATTFDGTLAVEWLGGYVPAMGNSFPMITYGSRTGAFGTLDLPQEAQWRADYGSTVFSLTVADISKLAFARGPVSTNAGAVLGPVIVQLQDATGNPLARSGVAVTISLASGTGPLDGTVSRTTAADGRATFDDLRLTVAGAKTLTALAADAGLTPVTSASFFIGAGVPARLTLATPISSQVTSGGAFSPQPVLQVLDLFGNVANQTPLTITARISSGPGSLAGGTTVNGNGQVAFTSLRYQPRDPALAETFVAYFDAPGLAPVTNNPVLASLALTNLVLRHGNSVVRIDPTSSRGLYSWTVDGIEQAHQHWLWVRAGTNISEISLDQLSAPSGMEYSTSNVVMRYSTAAMDVQVGFTLHGGPAASQNSELSGTLTVQNSSSSPLTLHLYVYSDLDLRGNAEADMLAQPAADSLVQAGKRLRASIIHTPVADHWEGAHYGILLSDFGNASPLILSDRIVPPAEGDQTYALQWDVALDAGETFTAGWLTQIAPDPLAQPGRVLVPIPIHLAIQRAGAGWLLSWPSKGTGSFSLHATEDLAGTWRPISEVPRLVGDQYELVLPQASGACYFRLQQW